MIAAVVALAVGVAIGWLAFGDDASSDDAERSAAEVDVVYGCTAILNLGDLDLSNVGDDFALDAPGGWRFQAAVLALQAAGLDDSTYRNLGEDAELLRASFARFDEETFASSFADVRDECADELDDLGVTDVPTTDD